MNLVVLVVLLPAIAQADDRLIGLIDFYGYGSLDVTQLQKLLPYRVGDTVPSPQELRAAARAYAKTIGRDRAKFEPVCCQPDGRMALFVGLQEPGVEPLQFLPPPNGEAKLPADLVRLLTDVEHESVVAVGKGLAREDDSKGYALGEYEPERALQLKLHESARTRVAEIIHVLESSADGEQRRMAAQALGYADASREQIAALVRASLDPDAIVRNNAIRALGVLLEYDSHLLAQIPLKPYIALMHSVDWADRNKASFLIVEFTKSRDPEVLKALREGVLAPLREMAQWRSFGHAIPAIQVLIRIAGLPEERILEVFQTRDVTPILAAVK
jgi:hypothetical protein